MNKKILLVEDEIELRENIKDILELSSFVVTPASNGVEALQLLGKESFDLVISDIMMPKIDGIDLLKRFREKEYWLETPFIFLTAKMDLTDQRKGMESGAEDYLIKPVKAKDLLAAIEIALSKRDARNQQRSEELKHIFGKQRKVFFHEMNTPLTSVVAALEFLKLYGRSLPEQDFEYFVDQAMLATKRLDTSLKKLKRYQTIDSITVSPSSIGSLKSFIEGFLLQRGCLSKAFITTKHDCSISFTEKHLVEILDLLIENALRYSPEDSKISLELDVNKIKITNKQVFFDQPQKITPKPFQQFARETYEQQGLGLGLFIAEKLARKNNAELLVFVTKEMDFEVVLNFGSFLAE